MIANKNTASDLAGATSGVYVDVESTGVTMGRKKLPYRSHVRLGHRSKGLVARLAGPDPLALPLQF